MCQSLRQVSQEWSALLDSSVGLRTINDRINQIEPLLKQARSETITDVPAVVQFDGIWLRVQSQTDTLKPDKRGRQRHHRSGKKVVLLVALGLWTDGSGKRERQRLAGRRWGKPSGVGPVCASLVGTGGASGERAASRGQRWLWGVRRGGGLGVWNHSRRATLHLS